MEIAFCDDEPDNILFHEKSGRNTRVGTLPMSIKKKRGLVDDASSHMENENFDEDEFYDGMFHASGCV